MNGSNFNNGFPNTAESFLNSELFVLYSPRGNNFPAMVSGVVDGESVSGLELFVAHDAGMDHIHVDFSVPHRLGFAG